MKNYVFLAGMVGIAFTSACKKKDSFASDRRNLLIGRWERITGGADLNENGQLEASEYESKSDDTRYYYTYKSNDSGNFFISYPVGGAHSFDILFTWKLTDGAQYLETDYHRGQKTVGLKITEFTAETLLMHDTMYKPATFVLLRKVE